MKPRIKELLKDKFVLGAFFLTAANFGGAFLNYLVHPILARNLSVSDYGDFQALLSFTVILGLLSAVINATLTREVSVLSATRPEEIEALRKRAFGKFLLFGFFVFILVVIFVQPLNQLFKISERAVLIIASLNFLYILPSAVNRSVLSGRQDFSALATSNLLDAFSRLLFMIFFVVILHLNLVGAAWSLGLAGGAAFLLSFYQVKRLRLPVSSNDLKPSLRLFWRYSFMVLWFTILTQFFYNFDMLLVKGYFNPEEAGLYGALLTIGRIIYFAGGAVPLVMFPVVANLKEDKNLRSFKVLAKSIVLLMALAVPAYLVISMWPEFIIRFIVGSKYLSIAPYLPGISLVMLIFTVVAILSNYFLALSSRPNLIILTVGALLEIALLITFHGSLSEIISVLNIIFGLMGIALLSLAILEYKKAKDNLYVQDQS